MIKLCYGMKIISALLVVGGMGSLEIDNIDMWTFVCQSLLGVTMWLLSSKWEEEIEFYENKKSPLWKVLEEVSTDFE